VQDISLKVASIDFMSKLKQKYPNLPEKKYYYLNVWNTKCKPCIGEMPYLDSLAGVSKSDIAFVFITDDMDDLAEPFIERKGLKFNHSYRINDAIGMISGVMSEKKTKEKIYPMHAIISSDGDLLHYHIGANANGKDIILESALKKIGML
jgi:thiol-disulfide isomerase/thioredoxin